MGFSLKYGEVLEPFPVGGESEGRTAVKLDLGSEAIAVNA